MKAKFFQTFDPIYHKKVKAVNIILTPEEKESFQKGLNEIGEESYIGPKLKQFLRAYKPYEPDNEDKEFPNGAYNTVIFEDMYLRAFLELIELICIYGIQENTIKIQKTIIDNYENMIEFQKIEKKYNLTLTNPISCKK